MESVLSTAHGPEVGGGARWVAHIGRTASGRFELDLTAPGDERVQLAQVGGCHLVFAGLLQNRAELAASLPAGSPDRSDAEIVAAAYWRDSEDMLAKLRGRFALALVDTTHDTVLCARDQIGAHSLFYAEHGNHLYVSASTKALVAQPGVSPAVNVAALVDHLRRRWLFAEETYFESVRRVPPAHVLRIAGGRRDVVRYWDPAPPGAPIDWVEPDDLELFGDILERAVARCVSIGPVGIFLSGGLDSVAVAALAAAIARNSAEREPWALSLAFPRPDVNEEHVQRGVAGDLRLPHFVLGWDEAVGADGLIPAAVEMSGRAAAPLDNFWSPAYDRLAQEGKNRGCTVVLTGAGGDEWLGVNPYYAADLLRTLNLVGLYRLFDAQNRSYQVSALLFLRNVLWRFGTRALLGGSMKRVARKIAPDLELARRLRRARRGMPLWLAPDPALRDAILKRERTAYAETVASEQWMSQRLPRRYPVHYLKEARTALTHPLMAREHEETFEQAHRVGLDLLQPFWDVEVIEFLYRVPPELLNRGGRSKGLVRETLAQRFPDLGFESQRKIVAADFARSLFIREGALAWRRSGGVPALEEAGIVDPAAVGRDVEGLLRGVNPREAYRIWDLLSCEAWFRAQL